MTPRKALIVAVIVLFPLALHAVWDQWEASSFANEIMRIADRQELTDLSVLRRPLASAEQRRSASLYAAAAQLSSNLMAAEGGSQLYRIDFAVPDSSSSAAVAAATDVLARAEPAMSLLDLATPLDFAGFSTIAAELNENQFPLDTLNLQACLKADILSARGAGDDAVRYFVQAARLQRTMLIAFYRNQATVRLYGSVRILLNQGRPSPPSLLALQHTVEEWPDIDDVAAQLIRTRARLIDDVWHHPASGTGWAYRIQPWRGTDQGITFFLLRPLFTDLLRREVQSFDRAIAIAKLPLPDRFDAVRDFRRAEAAAPPAVRAMFTRTFGFPPAGLASGILANENPFGVRHLAFRRTIITALAIERYRADHDGNPPDALSTLVPAYLSAVPHDPFTTGPLTFRKTGDSYVVYSVDLNRVDDGGELYGAGSGKNAYPVRRDDLAPADIGIRVHLSSTR
jgi:hypothetical protein